MDAVSFRFNELRRSDPESVEVKHYTGDSVSDVVVTFEYPSFLSPESFKIEGGDCEIDNSKARCTLDTIADGTGVAGSYVLNSTAKGVDVVTMRISANEADFLPDDNLRQNVVIVEEEVAEAPPPAGGGGNGGTLLLLLLPMLLTGGKRRSVVI